MLVTPLLLQQPLEALVEVPELELEQMPSYTKCPQSGNENMQFKTQLGSIGWYNNL